MDIDGLVQALFGSKRAETQEVSTDGTTRTYTGVALTDSEDGTVVIDLGGDVTLPDDLYDEDGNVIAEWDGVGVEMPTSPQVSAGDDVIVTLMGGSATKMPMVTSSAGSGDRMRTLVNAAQTVADAAQAVAEAVNQHFFADTNGIHVTEVTQEEWGESPTGANVLINSIGQLFRDGLNNLLTLTTENGARSLTIWDGLGNAAGNIRAIIGETIQLGKTEGPHMTLDSSSMGFWASAAQLAMRFTGRKVDYPSNSTYFAVIEDGVTRGSGDNDNGSIYLRTTETPTYQGSDEKVVTESEVRMRAYARDGEDAHIGVFVEKDVDSSTATSAAELVADTARFEGERVEMDGVLVSQQRAAVSLRNPCGTYTGTSSTATASASGWQLTYFNTAISEQGSPRTYDYTFSNGVLAAKRDCVLEISGVMNWTDAIAGNRGFGIFDGEVGGSNERSAFQNFPSTISNRKSVVFPPRLFALSAGDALYFGRYQQQNAVYTNGTNYSWVTIRVVG